MALHDPELFRKEENSLPWTMYQATEALSDLATHFGLSQLSSFREFGGNGGSNGEQIFLHGDQKICMGNKSFAWGLTKRNGSSA